MAELISQKEQQSRRIAPVVAIGGLLTGNECRAWYNPLINDGQECNLPPSKRFFPPPQRGLGEYEEMYKRLEEQVLDAHQKIGGEIIVAGHSLGAPFAEEIVLNNPNIATNVVTVAGVHEGQLYQTLTSIMLKYALCDPVHAKDLKHNSSLMTELKERVASEWPENVKLHSVATLYDDLLPFPHGMRLKMPEGQDAERRVISLPTPGLEAVLRYVANNNRISLIPSFRPAFHIDIVRHPGFIKYVRNLQTGNSSPESGAEIISLQKSEQIQSIAA